VVDAVIYFLVEIAGPVILEVLTGYGLGAILATRTRQDRWLRAVAQAAIGLVLGGLSLLVHAATVFPSSIPIRIAGLVVVPILAGVFMRWVGTTRHLGGRIPASIASFAGGATIAFAYALVRFLAHLRRS